jgi:hypothetical protein
MPEATSGPQQEPIEARCGRCGETFELISSEDAMHFQRRDGELCGGDGVPFRAYVIRESKDRRRSDRRGDENR